MTQNFVLTIGAAAASLGGLSKLLKEVLQCIAWRPQLVGGGTPKKKNNL
jgi:hypothetical protein